MIAGIAAYLNTSWERARKRVLKNPLRRTMAGRIQQLELPYQNYFGAHFLSSVPPPNTLSGSDNNPLRKHIGHVDAVLVV